MMTSGASRREVQARIAAENGSGLAVLVDEVPDAHNRIAMGRGRDRFGLPRTTIHYTWSARIESQLDRIKSQVAGILREMRCRMGSVVTRPAAHPMGTCRMSRTAATGVVDPDLRVHGIDNLYVCGSAVFPTGGAVNPTLTIAALAHRLGGHLARARPR